MVIANASRYGLDVSSLHPVTSLLSTSILNIINLIGLKPDQTSIKETKVERYNIFNIVLVQQTILSNFSTLFLIFNFYLIYNPNTLYAFLQVHHRVHYKNHFFL